MYYNSDYNNQYGYDQSPDDREMDMDRDMNSDMDRDMDMDMDREMDMNREMDMDRDMDNYMDSYMDREMDKDRNMSRRTYRSDMKLAQDLSKAIEGETNAYYSYGALAKLAPNEADRQTILGIQHDEAMHYNWFGMMLRMMGEEMPRVQMGKMPRDFVEGVRDSIKDELEASGFYEDTSLEAEDPNARMLFSHASQDEQRHATLLQNILINMLLDTESR
jgi:rubrerythrin